MTKLAIYGAGGLGREVAWLAETIADAGRDLAVQCFIDDAARPGQRVNGIDVLRFDDLRDRHPDAEVVVAVGAPRARMHLVERVASAGFAFATLLHPRLQLSDTCSVGEGSLIMVGATVTTNVRIGAHVQVNPGCTIAHDVVLEDFVTVTPGVDIAGFVTAERGAYLGIGATIIQGTSDARLRIGPGAVVGAGAVVTASVRGGETVVGVPARPIASRRPAEYQERSAPGASEAIA